MSKELNNKVAIVTGASSGLGLAIAIDFAKKGAKVTLCGRDEQKLKAALDECVVASGGINRHFTTVKGDLIDAGVRKAIVDTTVQQFGCLDILVNNAGVSFPNTSVADTTEADYDKTMDVNLKAPFFLSQLALPHLEKSGGNIINISSMLGALVAVPDVVYSITKAAMDHMTRCLAVNLGPKGIRVNAVNPSFILTDIGREYPAGAAEHIAAIEAPKHPLYGKCAEAQDIANMVSFLASDAARFVTGQRHVVDGARSSFGGAFCL